MWTALRWWRWTRWILPIAVLAGTIVLGNTFPRSWAGAWFFGCGSTVFVVLFLYTHIEPIVDTSRDIMGSILELRRLTIKDVTDGLKELQDRSFKLIVTLLQVAGVAIGLLLVWRVVSPTTFSQTWYETMYSLDSSHVFIEPEPHDCDFVKSPLGDKECHFKKSVAFEKDDKGTVVNICFGSAGNGEVTLSVNEDSAPSGRGFSRHERLSSDAGCW
jgi:hypothetical protein